MQSANSIILQYTNTSSSQGADSESMCNQSYKVRTSACEKEPKMINTASAATAGLHATITTHSIIPVRKFRAWVTGAESARALLLDQALSLTRVQDSGGPMPVPTPMHELHDLELSSFLPLLTEHWQVPPDQTIPPVRPTCSPTFHSTYYLLQ